MRCYQIVVSPIGDILLVAEENFLTQVDFLGVNDRTELAGIVYRSNQVLEQAKEEITAYFQGTLTSFTVPYAYQGTEFQKKVWQALTRIPYGETLSYEALAREINHPRACRAVGQANHRNPLAIIVPCHRVIGKNGHLIGYGGGLDKKVWLLQWEQRILKEGKILAK
ncbi:MAG: methylated-DNA--[protein]-cysteine S-methyltransferase [Bacillota bacterium]|uniref:Methylated-DNA--protein-cysteine methyltransferase n=1 Tax=Thermanaerosceptrum fracticalcis TaxID=1712410 RepID=A0A7G6E631_THEFR|nr:methylated-DNA--[protein]-cysteine S-methyltransferase [Thermanaerosceptrum fracticalcis]QNB47535.1 methylated-DNA--[protein]-cysteine S-methyltransferase [Thermanaerosceptrum fracticalcis]